MTRWLEFVRFVCVGWSVAAAYDAANRQDWSFLRQLVIVILYLLEAGAFFLALTPRNEPQRIAVPRPKGNDSEYVKTLEEQGK